MYLTSCESVLKCFNLFLQPYRHQQWLPSQPDQNIPPSTGTIPRHQELPQQAHLPLPETFARNEVHFLQESQDREMVMAEKEAEEEQKKADILMIPSRSSPTGAPSTGHSSTPPPQQKQGAKTQKKRKKAELIPGMWSLFELFPPF